MTTILIGIFVLLLTMSLAVVGLLLAQRQVPLPLRQSHNITIGIIYGVLYIVFGVIVGFTAYLVLNKYATSQSIVVSEAGDVRAIYYLAEGFPNPQQDQLQELVISYARVVVDEEWPLMKEGQTSPRAAALAGQIRSSAEGLEPSTNPQQALYTQMLERVHDLDQHRDVRLLNVREGLPPILWVALIILAISIVLFTYLLGMEDARLHALAVTVLTASVALILFTIVVLDRPFGGDFRVRPDAFELVQNEIEGDSGQGP